MNKTHLVTVTGAAYCGRVHSASALLVERSADVTCNWCRKKLRLPRIKPSRVVPR